MPRPPSDSICKQLLAIVGSFIPHLKKNFVDWEMNMEIVC